MAKQLDKAYQPKDVEGKIYRAWERSGFFNPDNLPAIATLRRGKAGLPGTRTKAFSIAMPPPNVTGELHLGHATGITVEDTLIRYHRMRGDKTLYLPGTDHAGISTQIMVERLIAQAGLNRHALGRAEFVKRVWDWKKKYGSRITEQIRSLGASCDWSREHFTMDPTLTRAVQAAFVTMFNDGLIYRGDRIVNWCPRCASALSDLEVKHQSGTTKLYYIRYPLFGTTKYLTVATTRPETMLGDTAVAVNPSDKRYRSFVGKTVLLPITNREIPIVADRRVATDFGTGAVKVTPAHDHIDYEIGQEHKLPVINVIGPDAKMTKEAGEFYGKSVQEARHELLQRLEDEELLEQTVDYLHNLARCDRCGTPIEPLISKQWFVSIKKLAKPAIAAVQQGKIKLVPKRFEKVYFHWMHTIKDWCISRQLWWGHQIPVWYRGDEVRASVQKPAGKGWRQDEDTLDTWFSSGLWTFSTLGWPKQTQDLKSFHPTTVMETGWDILFFWVARMIMMSLYFTKEVPFKTVYLHGLVLDRDGKKMSKSKGTGVDPIPMTEKYGTDAIRLSLVLGTSAGQDFRLYEEKIAGYRNFINKLWNVTRFILAQPTPKGKLQVKTLADKWIMAQLNQLIASVTKNINDFKLSEAGTALYDFLWRDFADWYLEIAKVDKNHGLLRHVLTTWLKLAHPFIPFVTEEIWSRFAPGGKKNLLIVQEWPQADKKAVNKTVEKEFGLLQEFITAIRNAKSTKEIVGDITANIHGEGADFLNTHKTIIGRLAKCHINPNIPQQGAPDGFAANTNFWFIIAKSSTQRSNEAQKKTIAEISSYIQKLEAKLTNKNFTERAPKEVVDKERQKLAEQREKLKKLL